MSPLVYGVLTTYLVFSTLISTGSLVSSFFLLAIVISALLESVHRNNTPTVMLSRMPRDLPSPRSDQCLTT